MTLNNNTTQQLQLSFLNQPIIKQIRNARWRFCGLNHFLQREKRTKHTKLNIKRTQENLG